MIRSNKNKRLFIVLAILFVGNIIAFGQSGRQNLNIVFIGNSITYGAGLSNPATEAPPAIAADYLKQQSNVGVVEFSNQGHSGYTTVDFLPASGEAFKQVEQAAFSFADKKALLIFSIKLGTNDSAIEGPHGAPVNQVTYRQNLITIADSLLKEFPGCIIVFEHPVWYSPNTYNGARYLEEGLQRLQTYIPQIDQMVEDYAVTYPKRVFVGDTNAFDYFKKHAATDLQAENGNQGIFYLHPNKQGAEALGIFWGKAINKILKKLAK